MSQALMTLLHPLPWAAPRPAMALAGLALTTALAGPAMAQSSSRPVATVRAPSPVEQPLGDAELAIAAGVYVGTLACELGQTVTLQPDAQRPGYFHLRLGRDQYHVRPVVSRTGAVRLEDPVRGAVWLQLSHKSMLMNQKLGRRLADECAGPVQRAAADALRLKPAPDLLDVAQSPRPD